MPLTWAELFELHPLEDQYLRCSACPMATHRGTLVVEGDQVLHPNGPAHVGPTKLDDAIVRTQARDALVGLGWKPNIARTAVAEAISAGSASSLEELIREALRRCPLPSS